MDDVFQQDIPLGRGLVAELVYSPDDSGWYFTVYREDSGRTVYASPRVFDDKQKAIRSIQTWRREYA